MQFFCAFLRSLLHYKNLLSKSISIITYVLKYELHVFKMYPSTATVLWIAAKVNDAFSLLAQRSDIDRRFTRR